MPSNRTVLLPLIQSRHGKVAEAGSAAGGVLDSIRDTLTSYLPLARAGARAGRSAEPRCEMSAADTAAVAGGATVGPGWMVAEGVWQWSGLTLPHPLLLGLEEGEQID